MFRGPPAHAAKAALRPCSPPAQLLTPVRRAQSQFGHSRASRQTRRAGRCEAFSRWSVSPATADADSWDAPPARVRAQSSLLALRWQRSAARRMALPRMRLAPVRRRAKARARTRCTHAAAVLEQRAALSRARGAASHACAGRGKCTRRGARRAWPRHVSSPKIRRARLVVSRSALLSRCRQTRKLRLLLMPARSCAAALAM